MGEEILYEYQALKHEDSIRLLRLGPKSSDGAVQIAHELIDVRLSTRPDYEAISYTWGKPPFTGTLTTSLGTIPIPLNLDHAFKQLAYPDRQRLLWADAVCINQSDLTEKSAQVAMMGDVFQKARQVLIWLGLSDQWTAHVFKIFRTLLPRAQEFTVDRNSIDTAQDGAIAFPQPKQMKMQTDVASEYDFRGMDEFYANPWFRRLWVVQETALAREMTLHCGEYEISYIDFVTGAMVHYRMVAQSYPSHWKIPDGFYEALTIFAARWRLKQNSEAALMMNIVELRSKQCSVDVDRIFALLKMRGPKDPQIYPDYTKSFRDVSISAMEGIIRVQISVLAYAGIAPRMGYHVDGQRSDIDPHYIDKLHQLCRELPSWVADWRVTKYHSSFSFFWMGFPSAASQYQAYCDINNLDQSSSVLSGPILSIKGLIIDRVHGEKGPSKTEIQGLAHVRQRLLETKTLYDTERDRITQKEEDALIVFARTIVVGGHVFLSKDEHLSKPWTAEDLVNLWFIFMATERQVETQNFDNDDALEEREPFDGKDQYSGHEFHEYSLTLQRSLRNRTFFITEKGYVGLAPAMVRKGDVVALIAGLAVPFVLRPIPDLPPGTQMYYLIGDCYVDGIMHGEFFHDLDPNEVETMWQFLSLA
ncbi:MAG: hypothetical protein Q9174_003227 [Haloplaca sp. 1 TL-2023]